MPPSPFLAAQFSATAGLVAANPESEVGALEDYPESMEGTQVEFPPAVPAGGGARFAEAAPQLRYREAAKQVEPAVVAPRHLSLE